MDTGDKPRVSTVTRLEQFTEHEAQPSAIPFIKTYRTLKAAKKAGEDDAEAEEAGSDTGTVAASNFWRLFAWDQHRCAMPRYYFDVDIQDVSSVSDTEGMELQSLVEAKAEALSAISGMAQRFVPSVPEMSIHVRDETGRDVLRIRLSLVVEEIPE